MRTGRGSSVSPGLQGRRDVAFNYYANGNVAYLTVRGPTPPALTPAAHAFQYMKVNLEREYDPPQASPALAVKNAVYE